MARSFVQWIAFAVLAAAVVGCGTTLRHMTATSWLEPPGAASAPAPAAPSASGAAPATGGGVQSQYYITYWEGSCGWPFGCNRGETHVRRCKVNADNSVTCVEEANASKALNPN